MVSEATLGLFLQLKRWLPQIFKIRKTHRVGKWSGVGSGIEPRKKVFFPSERPLSTPFTRKKHFTLHIHEFEIKTQ